MLSDRLRIPRALRNFFLGYFILHLLAAGLFIFGLSQTIRGLMRSKTYEEMHGVATLTAEHINVQQGHIRSPDLKDHLSQLQAKTDFRFTLLDVNGQLIVDSSGVDEIDNIELRREFTSASTVSPGKDERFSEVSNQEMMFLAIPYVQRESDELSGYIRVGKSSYPIEKSVASVQRYFWIFALFLGVLTGMLMIVFGSMAMKPLSLFADAARRIGVGQYESFPALLSRNDEWRSLADAFRTMQSELASREQRIVKNRDRLQAVLSSMIEGVLAIAPDNNVLIANHAACRMLGVSESDMKGRNLLEVIRNPELSGAVEKTQNERTFSKTEFQIPVETSRRTISARVSVLPNEGQEDLLPGIVVVLHDISELRQLESMRRDFVANVSHELKTPLASIKAYAETLRLGAINDQERNLEFVDQIESQADVLNHQIVDLLQIARVESGREVWDIEPVSLNAAVDACVKKLAQKARQNQIELNVDLSDEQPHARADAEGLDTILDNLVTNALNYTPAGGQVKVSTSYQENSAIVEVVDTGIGIAPEHQSRVFERFYRVDKARSRDKGGTGLGLSIVKHLCQSFGGGVELTSQLGSGTTFRIRLPKFIQ